MSEDLKKLIAFCVYGGFSLAVVLSYLSNPAPTWIDIVATVPVLWPYAALVFLFDDRPLMWVLNGAVASIDWAVDYLTGSLPKPKKGS